jgi:xylulokinase
MGVTLAAGYSLNWLKHTFFEEESFDQLILSSSKKVCFNQFKLYPAAKVTPIA